MTRAGRVREQDRLEAVRLRSCAAGSPFRCCAWPSCEADGLYRAPLGKDRLREFQFFCLEHVREFNRQWDYFAGMSQSQIEAHQRADATWHRPSWRFGTSSEAHTDWHDVFELFGQAAHARRRAAPAPLTKAGRMMAVLELEVGFTLAELKARYKALAKQHHPDLHGGDKAAEERLKLIIEAYTYLREQRLYV